jgi:hypothetical protein
MACPGLYRDCFTLLVLVNSHYNILHNVLKLRYVATETYTHGAEKELDYWQTAL